MNNSSKKIERSPVAGSSIFDRLHEESKLKKQFKQ